VAGVIDEAKLKKLHHYFASLIFMELEAEKGGGGTSGFLNAAATLKNIHATATFGRFN